MNIPSKDKLYDLGKEDTSIEDAIVADRKMMLSEIEKTIIDLTIKTILIIGTLYLVYSINYYSYTIGFKFLIPLLVIAFVVSFILLVLIIREIK